MTQDSSSLEFVALWTAHSRRVYAYIFSLVPNWSDADDLFQETSVVLMQKFAEFEPGSNFSAWACRVAYLKVCEFRKRRPAFAAGDELFLEAVQAEAERLAEQDVHSEALSDCLARLAPKDRRLIELRYRGDYSVQSVAAEIGRSAAAVYKALARIHETLLECVRRKIAEGDRP